MSTEPTSAKRQICARTATATAIVAAIFVLAVAALLGWDFTRRLAKDPLESAEFKDLKKQLALNPKDESLKKQIRDRDLQLREAYFRQRAFTARGAWMLVGGIAVLLAAAKVAATLRRRLPEPEFEPAPEDTDLGTARLARLAVGATLFLLIGLAIGLSMSVRSDLGEVVVANGVESEGSAASPNGEGTQNGESDQPSPAKPQTPAAKGLAEEKPGSDFAKSWSGFRGPDGRGISAFENVPRKFNLASGENVLWKTPLPVEGHNSPVIWKDRVFLSGATPEKRQVFCFNTADGKLLWQKDVTPENKEKPPEVGPDTGFAASTTTTDGRRVMAIFANGDVAAFDLAGSPAWSRSLGTPKSSYGFAASLRTWKNLLFIQFDQGAAKDNKSKLIALDSATGSTVWEVPRAAPNSWSTPILIEVKGQEQVVTASDPWVIAYSPADGKEIWRAKCLRQDVGPSPTFADGIVYVASEFPAASAIRADGQGDVTKSHILWTGEDGLPDTCTPLATSQFLLLMTSSGTMTCYEAKAGKKLWEQDFEANFKASPCLAGKNVYLVSDEGKVLVVEPSPAGCKKLAESTLGEPVTASPAFQDGRIYFRGKSHLFCIGVKK